MLEQGHESNSVHRVRKRAWAPGTTMLVGMPLAACGGGKGEVTETGGRIIVQGAPDIRLPRVPSGVGYSGWEVIENGRVIARRGTNGLEQYEQTLTVRPGARDDEEITWDEVEEVMCYAKVSVLGPDAVLDFVEGKSVYQQEGGEWLLIKNELEGGFPGSPCEAVERLIPDTEVNPGF